MNANTNTNTNAPGLRLETMDSEALRAMRQTIAAELDATARARNFAAAGCARGIELERYDERMGALGVLDTRIVRILGGRA